jgi:hypothetical protein
MGVGSKVGKTVCVSVGSDVGMGISVGKTAIVGTGGTVGGGVGGTSRPHPLTIERRIKIARTKEKFFIRISFLLKSIPIWIYFNGSMSKSTQLSSACGTANVCGGGKLLNRVHAGFTALLLHPQPFTTTVQLPVVLNGR